MQCMYLEVVPLSCIKRRKREKYGDAGRLCTIVCNINIDLIRYESVFEPWWKDILDWLQQQQHVWSDNAEVPIISYSHIL